MADGTAAGHRPAPEPVARTLVTALRAAGVDRVFCVAGESFLPLLDGLRDGSGIDVVTSRHEGSAGFAAVADAKLTGGVGVCLVSRGPGATNAAIAVHAARQDATALLLIVGQVPRPQLGREAFQELDCAAMFGSIAKAVWELRDGSRAAEFVARAVHRARSGTPGPVVLVVPEDVCGSDRPGGEVVPASPRILPPGTEAVDRTVTLLARARRPLLLAGGRLASDAGRDALAAAASRHALPVVCSYKHQDLFDNSDPHYAGHLSNATTPHQRRAFAGADLVLAVGTRLDPITTGSFRFPRAPGPEQPLVHVYPDPDRLGGGGTYRAELAVCADPAGFLRVLAHRPAAGTGPERTGWLTRLTGLERELARWPAGPDATAPDGVVFGEVVSALNRVTRGEVVVTVDAGAFTSWLYRYLRLGPRGVMLGVASSPMGFAVPAAVAAALRMPDRPVVAVVGDGGFGMNGSELATAVARDLRLTVIVANNSSYGTIRHHQERRYPGREVATGLVNPDFARLAEAYGALGVAAHTSADVEAALTKAINHPGPALVEVRTSLLRISAHHPLGGGGPA